MELAGSALDPSAVQRAGNLLANLDREIYAETRAQPLLLPLGHALEGDLQSLPDAELPVLARESARHYRTLGRRAALLERAVLGSESSHLTPPQETSP
jgi:hypothetical protein